MKKKQIVLWIIFLFLVPGLVFGSGQKDRSIVVPGNTVSLIQIDVQKNLAAGIFPVMLDLLVNSHNRDVNKKPARTVLDNQLKEIFGIELKDIEMVTISLLSLNIKEQPLPFAVHMKLKQDVPQKVLQHIKDTCTLDTNIYRGKTYLITQPPGRKTCFYTTGEDFIITNDTSIMESMLDALNGKGAVEPNKTLYALLKEFRENPFYWIGYVDPAGSSTPMPYPFEQVKEFGFSLVLGDDISFLLKAGTGSNESAEELIVSVKGSLSLAAMLLLAQDKKAYLFLASLIQKIQYVQKNSTAEISGRFTEKDIQNLADYIPVLLKMKK